GAQTEEPVEWEVEKFLQEEEPRISVMLEDRRVELRAWRYMAKGVRGYEVPVYFLDADLPANDARDRELTGALYGGDPYYRLSQEVLLGIGGVANAAGVGTPEINAQSKEGGQRGAAPHGMVGGGDKPAGRTAIKGEDI